MNMTPKIIKNEKDYDLALDRIEEIFDAVPGSKEFDELEVLVALVERYEDEKYPIALPDPITAIKFRMEQQNLKNKDLIPLIGSKSKVSEVLSGKRELSLNMIRKLNKELGIPAEVLIQGKSHELPSSKIMEHGINFPFTEMYNRGWFSSFFRGTLNEAKSIREELTVSFIGPLKIQDFTQCYNRKAKGGDKDRQDDILLAWRIRVMNSVYNEKLPKWKKESLNDSFFKDLLHLSCFDEGPKLAKEFLNKAGIHFVIEKHLKTTRLDGSSMLMPDGSPLVAMTLRYDRLDSFWFTLFHELSHVKMHLSGAEEAFFDDITNEMTSDVEKEADEYAKEMLIPDALWEESGLGQYSSAKDIKLFSERNRINPAIPAGKIRFQTKNYSVFSNLVGNGKVRKMFATD